MPNTKSLGILALYGVALFAMTGCRLTRCALEREKQLAANIKAIVEIVPPTPIPGSSSHNDFIQLHPLQDGYINGFTSYEADIHLRYVEDTNNFLGIKKRKPELMVAHTLLGIKAENTLEKLYLEPFAALYKKNDGKIFPGYDGDITLMIDVKSGDPEAHHVLHDQLKPYAYMLTTFDKNGIVKKGAITVLTSGNQPPPDFVNEYAGIDGRWKLLQALSHANKKCITQQSTLARTLWISKPWEFSWNGNGDMPEEQMKEMKERIEKVHVHGMKFRYWNIPDKPKVWQTLLEAGVDQINTDRLYEFHAWKLGYDAERKKTNYAAALPK